MTQPAVLLPFRFSTSSRSLLTLKNATFSPENIADWDKQTQIPTQVNSSHVYPVDETWSVSHCLANSIPKTLNGNEGWRSAVSIFSGGKSSQI